MVSLLSQKPGVHVGFNIDALLGSQTKMSTIGNEFLHNTESAFTNLKTPLKDANIRMDATTAITNRGGLNGNTVNVATSATAPTQAHSHRDNGEFCAQCFDSSTTNNQDNLLNSVRSYEMSTQSLTNLNSMNTRNLIRSAGLSSHPWSLIDPTHQHVPSVQSHDFRSHSNLGNFGLKFHNSLVQLDNISNIQSMQNIPSIANTYSPFSSLYSPVGQGQFGSQVVPSRVEHGVSGSAFTWSSNRGAGFLTSRCPDTGLFMQSYRKPKRVRTAFSPTQLLRLEHAFEKNHYVVGQERKDLSASLNLSETQVKVWFQNRRTKHKRMQAEDDMTSSMSMRMHESRDCKTPSLEDVVIDA